MLEKANNNIEKTKIYKREKIEGELLTKWVLMSMSSLSSTN